jgi:signal transduction histidine kinase
MESMNFRVDFSEAPRIFSVKPMINSILFNLISNAIKYQSPERDLLVSVRTYRKESYAVLEVGDNGLGINLKLFRKDIFKMYKRFHDHLEGKGLGLYLIKSQAESLNGFVEISSEPDKGTVFRVHVKNYETHL